MDEILKRARDRMPLDVERRLAVDPLATVLRRATWGAHEEVESGPLEAALADGRLHPDVYADLLAQTLPVYRAIEAIAPRMADHPIASPFVRPEVFRTAHVERDLAHYWGTGWADRVDLLPETRFYVERIETDAGDDALAWIAHGYTRYLADLSGGLVIDKAITQAYDLDQDGRWLYTFDLPAGIDPRAWKNAYRQLLNVLDLDASSATRLIAEALVAYQCNIAVNDALVARHGDIERTGQVA